MLSLLKKKSGDGRPRPSGRSEDFWEGHASSAKMPVTQLWEGHDSSAKMPVTQLWEGHDFSRAERAVEPPALAAEVKVEERGFGPAPVPSRWLGFGRGLLAIALLTLCAVAQNNDLALPATLPAGADLQLKSPLNGDAALYITGPGTAIKRDLKANEEVTITGDHLRASGNYLVMVKQGSFTAAKSFFVQPADVASISFLARPSRVPVSAPDAIRGTAFVFDQYDNLVIAPTPVHFELSVKGGGAFNQTVSSRDGVAWIKTASGRTQGAAQFVASAGNASVRRVVQLTAADPCNLRMSARATDSVSPDAHLIKVKGDAAEAARPKLVLVETDPIRDCSGNPVPDGTIVTFIQSGSKGRSTVDARVKRGIARATLPSVPGSTLSVASGVVLGNEIRWGGQ